MRKVANFLIGPVYAILRFILLGVAAGVIILLCLFSVDFKSKNYDLVFTSRFKSSIYYGIEYRRNPELWKIKIADDGSLYTIRLYP